MKTYLEECFDTQVKQAKAPSSSKQIWVESDLKATKFIFTQINFSCGWAYNTARSGTGQLLETWSLGWASRWRRSRKCPTTGEQHQHRSLCPSTQPAALHPTVSEADAWQHHSNNRSLPAEHWHHLLKHPCQAWEGHRASPTDTSSPCASTASGGASLISPHGVSSLMGDLLQTQPTDHTLVLWWTQAEWLSLLYRRKTHKLAGGGGLQSLQHKWEAGMSNLTINNVWTKAK